MLLRPASASRPATLLHENQRKQFIDALVAASRHKMVRLHIGRGLAGAPPDVLAAAAKDAREIDLASAELRRLALAKRPN